MDLAKQFPLNIYNTLKRDKVVFEPASPPFVGMYVCGPTVYSEPHLGHARNAINFDTLYRYLSFLGYRVRYVRNITDVGHLEDEVAGAGEDRITKRAKLEKVEPMELVQTYTNIYHDALDKINTSRPSIEPTASGHITEQIEAVKKILARDLAYEVDGSVYFDLEKYAKQQKYGQLSGKVLEDLQVGSRDTEGLSEKRGPHDFALWKKAAPEHIMRWPSPWGEGFPGWHIECSVMSTKYLGEVIDIHGGGMDLCFPHHEAEMAQNFGVFGKHSVRYWIHHNMITINGQKMARSKGNFITINELLDGSHELLEQAYSPMTVRFFVLQAHYRSPVDFSNEALQAAEKGLRRLMNAVKALEQLGSRQLATAAGEADQRIAELREQAIKEMSDDLNTAKALAVLYELAGDINTMANATGALPLTQAGLELLKQTMHTFVFDIMGLKVEQEEGGDVLAKVVDLLIRQRAQAKADKNYAQADAIRDELAAIGVQLKDGKEGTTFSIE